MEFPHFPSSVGNSPENSTGEPDGPTGSAPVGHGLQQEQTHPGHWRGWWCGLRGGLSPVAEGIPSHGLCPHAGWAAGEDNALPAMY